MRNVHATNTSPILHFTVTCMSCIFIAHPVFRSSWKSGHLNKHSPQGSKYIQMEAMAGQRFKEHKRALVKVPEQAEHWLHSQHVRYATLCTMWHWKRGHCKFKKALKVSDAEDKRWAATFRSREFLFIFLITQLSFCRIKKLLCSFPWPCGL